MIKKFKFKNVLFFWVEFKIFMSIEICEEKKVSEFHGPLAQITFNLNDGKEEILNLMPGDNLDFVVNQFCKKFGFDGIQEAIKDELKDQLQDNDVDMTPVG